jgi:mono/diheme cytochrome c family protein
MQKIVMIATLALGVGSIGYGVWQMAAQPEKYDLLPYQDADAIARGEVLYLDYCASCHGDDLQGQANWRQQGADGLLPAPPHDETGHSWHHSDAQLIATVTLGTERIVGQGYRSAMIGFGDQMTDAEIRETLAYIKSTWPADVISTHNDINRAAAQK